MKYLTLSASYNGPLIREGDKNVNCEELGVGHELCQELIEWNECYKKIIPLSIDKRRMNMTYIEMLDERGISLAKKLSQSIIGGAKVKYYSEGKLRYICEIISQ